MPVLRAALVLALLPAGAAGQQVEDLVNIRFASDARVFAVMAAINAAGFDLDAGGAAPESPRAAARAWAAGLDDEVAGRLRTFYLDRGRGEDDLRQQARYLSLALHMGPPPGFQPPAAESGLPEEARGLRGFENLLKDLWLQRGLARLWEETRPAYDREAAAYRPLIRGMIVDTLAYFRTEARVAFDRKVNFLPDLLNAFGVVNARNTGDEYYLVVGPSAGPGRPLRSVRHEYLHFLIDPLVVKYTAYLPEERPFLQSAGAKARVQPHVRADFHLLLGESLIRAAEIRLERWPGSQAQAQLVRAYEEGLVLAPYFFEALGRFERAEGSITGVFLALVEGISWEREKRRDGEMEALAAELTALQKREAEAESAGARRLAETREKLERANALLLARSFSEAEALLEEVLKDDPRNANALFGLAQAAGQAQNLERALQLYADAAAQAGEQQWLRAWSLVRRGNIFLVEGDSGRAAQEYEKALALKGDLRGAAEAARRALEEMRKDPPRQGELMQETAARMQLEPSW